MANLELRANVNCGDTISLSTAPFAGELPIDDP